MMARLRMLPRATLAATLILVACAAVAFGFVLQRGGLLLPEVSPSPAAVAVAPSPAVSPSLAPAPSPSSAPLVPGSTRGPTTTAGSTNTPGAVPVPTRTPAATATATPAAAPLTTPAPGPVTPASPSASRLTLLKKCPGRTDCYIYTIRPGDNLWSIAHWFGVPVDQVLARNAWIGPQAIVRAGQALVIPSPTR